VRSIERALERQADAARHKVHGLRQPGRFIVSGALAGAYVGIAVVMMVNISGPLAATGSGAVKLVNGLVFGVALVLIVFGGGELVTSSMMTLTQGTLVRATRAAHSAGALAVTFLANALGAAVFASVIALSGVLHANPAAAAMLDDMLEAKGHETPVELFVRGVLCNVLVCLAVWMCARLKSDVAKILVIVSALLPFVASGFEHVVANLSTFSIGLLTGAAHASWGAFAGNILWVGLGNLLGGMLVGIAYWFVGGSPRVSADDAARIVDPGVHVAR